MSKYLALFLGIYALILWGLVGYVFYKAYHEWKDNKSKRLHSRPAKVMDKRETKGGDRYLLFQFDGRQVEYKVAESVYESLRVGDEGTLNLCGREFASFDHKSQDERADDIFRRIVKD